MRQAGWGVALEKEAPLAVSAVVKARNRVVFQPDDWGGCYTQDLAMGRPRTVRPLGPWNSV